MRLLGLDLETGGDFKCELEDNFITEIGLVLWDTDFNSPVDMKNILINPEREISKDAEIYTGITNEMAQKYGHKLVSIYPLVIDMVARCDFVVAHNALNFDKPIMERVFDIEKKTWIDTTIDVDYPVNCVSRNLTYLAGFHLILNSFPHRAITDVLTMLTILSKYDLDKIIMSAESPMVKLEAIVSFEQKDLAKDAGFKWEPGPKKWTKEMRQIKVEDFSKDLNFLTKEKI